ncbi:NADH-peroxiredoxin reductase [Thermobacillus xylanilyticus]|jgi:alkyl hydroperoxide reductase subunit F|uniref:Alkyl hydroperoxide reductase, F subunit n=2 Tax=Thermobacillus TaxID=76632 RepID=L0ECE4_THECK|nr:MULTISPECIES: alkyl hydroperoxide reductase subunit F [Thermobacillus]AGA57346.1 alkyl hydroperoxide reductase, F subunit [Thermobacillus composti KWC4]REJ17017.1 MAG: alkyl hydroperoxide reductase subunit F [Paenibacillaceae bacterium]CAG5090815.1 NADH-peroxiredoxin reductase [Thermobacillus xylanilyticus]
MKLDADIRAQLQQYLQLLEGDVVIKVSAGSDSVSRDMLDLLDELTGMSSRITVERAELARTPSFSVNRPGEDTGIVFAGVPLGHEFTSLVLALLQVSGRPPKVDDEVIERIKSIKGEYRFETYVSLSCHNCPDVVQALNVMSVLNPGISHTMIDGAAYKEEVERKEVMAVPTVYLNGEFFESGRMTLDDILNKLGVSADAAAFANKEPFDVLVIGGGPAGSSAAIYAARKGIRTGIVADRFGGQVNDTLGIENLISVKHTEGPQLAVALEEHVKEYPVDIMKSVRAEKLEKKDLIEVTLNNGAVLKSKTVIIATGARWRNLNVPGEEEFKNKGVAYCPHCDGPLFAGKQVAVVGGGNSGVEAAIDLAGIAAHVTLFEFMPELKADQVLQDRLYSLPNVTVHKNAQVKEITGSSKMEGITYIDRATGEEHHLAMDGVFVQIGLVPNTEWLEGVLERTRMGEIVVDSRGATAIPGVFAAGDCTNSAYKQIIISMGSGATAALSAFDYLIRN